MTPRKRSAGNGDLPDNLYNNGGYFRYKHPLTGDYHQMGVDKNAAIAAAKKLNAILVKKTDLVMRVLGADSLTWANLVDKFIAERQAKENKKASTTREENYRLEHVRTKLGSIRLEDTTQRLLSDWLDEHYSGNPYTKHRGTLIKLMDFGIAKGMFPDGTKNLASSTLPEREGEKVRQILELDAFIKIREQAAPWAQVGMDFGLVSLQRLGDLVKAKFTDIEGSTLSVVQNKTERHGERARLKINIGTSLAEIISRSRALPPLSPFIVHRAPERKVKFEGQEHWSQVRGALLSKEFNRARDATGLFKHLGSGEAPTFHEIRGLGGAQYLAQGYSKEYVNLLMGHTTQRMTDSYTDQHDNWTVCAAELRI
jgi:integrase